MLSVIYSEYKQIDKGAEFKNNDPPKILYSILCERVETNVRYILYKIIDENNFWICKESNEKRKMKCSKNVIISKGPYKLISISYNLLPTIDTYKEIYKFIKACFMSNVVEVLKLNPFILYQNTDIFKDMSEVIFSDVDELFNPIGETSFNNTIKIFAELCKKSLKEKCDENQKDLYIIAKYIKELAHTINNDEITEEANEIISRLESV